MTELSGKVEELLGQAQELAAARGHSVVGTEHLLLAMTRLGQRSGMSPERTAELGPDLRGAFLG
jgi:ATP-dependent Clp protease ATP-binding subunit ClpA